MSRYETPTALRHDADTLIADVHALIDATAEIADQKVADARQRLTEALERGKEVCGGFRGRVADYARVADTTVREHPYQGIAAAFGLGALLGFILTRRD